MRNKNLLKITIFTNSQTALVRLIDFKAKIDKDMI